MFKKNRVQTLLLLIKSLRRSALYVRLLYRRIETCIKRVQHVHDPQWTIKHLYVGTALRGNFYEHSIKYILPSITYIIIY